MNTSAERRRDFSVWLRTGRWPSRGNVRGLEFKFNPYHDPANGQFTSADGSAGVAGFTPATGRGRPGTKVVYESNPNSAPIANMAEADAWRARELAEHGGNPEYAAAIEARYQVYVGQFSKSTRAASPSVGSDSTSADRIAGGESEHNDGGDGDDHSGDHAPVIGPMPSAMSSHDVAAQSAAPDLSGAIASPRQLASLAASGPEQSEGRGNNSRAFEDPMTLEQAFPGLQNAPGGAVFAVADNLLDLTGPANAFMTQFLQDQSRQLIAQIKALDPKWRYDEIVPTDALGVPIITVQGLSAKVNDLRFQRAAVIGRVRGDYRPLQVETLRFVQRRTDGAYEDGQALLKAGRLTPRLSESEALGNYIDRRVREDLRDRYNQLGIDSAGAGPVRVNRREDDSSGTDNTYRRPDSRVADVAFDVTLTRKTLGTAQIRGFFNADFRPSRVVIIRPSQLGANHTYVIFRPETK